MSNLQNTAFRRRQAAVLADRLREPRRFLQIVTGPRQVGKTTLVEQAVADAMPCPASRHSTRHSTPSVGGMRPERFAVAVLGRQKGSD